MELTLFLYTFSTLGLKVANHQTRPLILYKFKIIVTFFLKKIKFIQRFFCIVYLNNNWIIYEI
jgi:hypothetical protein